MAPMSTIQEVGNLRGQAWCRGLKLLNSCSYEGSCSLVQTLAIGCITGRWKDGQVTV